MQFAKQLQGFLAAHPDWLNTAGGFYKTSKRPSGSDTVFAKVQSSSSTFAGRSDFSTRLAKSPKVRSLSRRGAPQRTSCRPARAELCFVAYFGFLQVREQLDPTGGQSKFDLRREMVHHAGQLRLPPHPEAILMALHISFFQLRSGSRWRFL